MKGEETIPSCVGNFTAVKIPGWNKCILGVLSFQYSGHLHWKDGRGLPVRQVLCSFDPR